MVNSTSVYVQWSPVHGAVYYTVIVDRLILGGGLARVTVITVTHIVPYQYGINLQNRCI